MNLNRRGFLGAILGGVAVAAVAPVPRLSWLQRLLRPAPVPKHAVTLTTLDAILKQYYRPEALAALAYRPFVSYYRFSGHVSLPSTNGMANTDAVP